MASSSIAKPLVKKPPFVISSAFVKNELEHQSIINELSGIRKTIESVETLTKSTNGRVTKLEKARWVVTGTLVVLIPVLLFIANTVLNNTGIIRKFEQLHTKELSTTPNSQEIR